MEGVHSGSTKKPGCSRILQLSTPQYIGANIVPPNFDALFATRLWVVWSQEVKDPGLSHPQSYEYPSK